MKFKYKDKEWYIDGYLASQLDSVAYNVNNDWDFVIMITGDRTVRVGKSVLAMTVSAYLSKTLNELGLKNKFDVNDIYFDNIEMMKAAFKKDKYHVNQYDEGREGLASAKAMKSVQQDLIDFFAECGQMNHVFVIVAPDYFKLNEEIAVARSEFLINVYRKEKVVKAKFNGEERHVTKLDRGFFEFFSRKKKQKLYDISQSTRRKSYGLVKADFYGRFTNQYPVGEDEYREKKKEALARFTEKKDNEKSLKHNLQEKFLQNWIAKTKEMNPKWKWDDILKEVHTFAPHLTQDAIKKHYTHWKKRVEVEAQVKSAALTQSFKMPD